MKPSFEPLDQPRELAGSCRLPMPLMKVGAVIFCVEMSIMSWFLVMRPGLLTDRDAVWNASFLTLVASVLIYFWVLQPLERQLCFSLEQLERTRLDAEQRSRVDPLTGVLNRESFFGELERQWDRSARYGTCLSCIMLDLDYFKQLNDSHGHRAGDATLREVGKILRSLGRKNDTICRYGGEEFCVILPEMAEKAAVQFAERLRAAIESHQFEYEGGALYATASLGVAERGSRMTFPDNLLENADRALLESKKHGRNCISVATPVPRETLPLVTHIDDEKMTIPIQ